MLRLGAGVLAVSLVAGSLPALGDEFDVPASGLTSERIFAAPSTQIDGLQLQVLGVDTSVPPLLGTTPPSTPPALPQPLSFRPSRSPVTFVVKAVHLDVAAPLPFFATAPALWQSGKGLELPEFFGLGGTLASDTYDARSTLAPELIPGSGTPRTFAAGPFTVPAAGQSVALTAPLRIGGLRMTGTLFAAHLQELQPEPGPPVALGAQYSAPARASRDVLGGGTAFAVPVLGRHVGIDLSGGVDHVQRNDGTLASYTPFDANVSALERSALSYQGSTGNVYEAYTPDFFDVYRVRMGADATLPITRDVIFGAGYDTQQFRGTAGTTLAPNVAERQDQVDLSLSYSVPKVSGAVLFSFHNNVYRDLTGTSVTNFNFTENREDLSFTIRF